MAKLTTEYRQAALRRGILVKVNRNTATPSHLLQAASLEFANLGFVVNPFKLAGMSATELTDALFEARVVIGADREMTPIYPGFPKQVEDIPTLTLLIEQLMHYWTAGEFLPNYPTIVREGLPLEDMLRNARELKVLPASATARALIESLVSDPVALSEDDRALLRGSIELQHPSALELSRVAKGARNGENLQSYIVLTAELTSLTGDEIFSAVAPHADNIDQLLRIVLGLYSSAASEKWASSYTLAVENLADLHSRAVRMSKLSRSTRRAVVVRLGALSANFYADRLVNRQNLWRGVMRAVHPYDFDLSEAEKRAADIIHSNVKYRTLNSRIEGAVAKGKLQKAVGLLAAHQPGNLLRRSVALLRLAKSKDEALYLAVAIRGLSSVPLTTLISAYNGIISANDSRVRVTRVAGLTNTMVSRASVPKVKNAHLKLVVTAVETLIAEALLKKDAPAGPVAITSSVPVPLVRRDAATADRTLDRGQAIGLAGEGDTLRIFGHWNNNQSNSGYMDIGVVILDHNFEHLSISTWDSWGNAREWSTYSGDKLVYPGGSAPEFIDVKLAKLREAYPTAKWAAMTVQAWSGWPIADVDFVAGAMLRSEGEKGDTFDPRSVATAFKPTTTSTQSVPFAVNLKTGVIVWIDSSNGSGASGVSSSKDSSIGSIVYDELARPRLTFGQLAAIWAAAHGVETISGDVDRAALLELLK